MSGGRPGPEPPPLPAVEGFGQLHLWLIDLDAGSEAEDWLLLDEAEQSRARRFVFAHDRRRYVAAHAALRRLLSACTAQPPNLLRFRTGEFGKPFLVGLPACFFNLSHSQGAGLIGISSTAEIGVDVEILRSIPDADALSRDNFSSAEQAALSSAQGPSRDLRFLSGWTRKEACLKAVGSGLSIHPATFEVGLEPETREVAIQSEAGLLGLRVGSFRHGTAILGALAQRL